MKSVGVPVYMESSVTILRGSRDYSVKMRDTSSSDGHSSDGH
jgi:hypothetical protein